MRWAGHARTSKIGVQELKGQGLAEHLQELGYAVFSMDLRWQGQNPRRALTADERPKLMEDLQAGYFFLVDRHNRGDLNLGKLGVVALGDGANLAAAWAIQPGAAITIEGRPSDLNALALISPNPEGFRIRAGPRNNRARPSRSSPPDSPANVIILPRMPCNRSARPCSASAQQNRDLSLLTPRLQTPSTRAQGHLDPLSLSGDNPQESARGMGATI